MPSNDWTTKDKNSGGDQRERQKKVCVRCSILLNRLIHVGVSRDVFSISLEIHLEYLAHEALLLFARYCHNQFNVFQYHFFLFHARSVSQNEPNNTIIRHGLWVILWLVLRTCFIVDCVSLSIIGKVIFSSRVRRSVLIVDGDMTAASDAIFVVVNVDVVDDDELLPPKSFGVLKSFLGGIPSYTWFEKNEKKTKEKTKKSYAKNVWYGNAIKIVSV